MSNELVPQVTYDKEGVELSLDINVDNNYTLKTFLWNDADGMLPIIESREFQ
ncbi:MAG: hypothetical protein RSA27_01775 [Oscillospiraceae bacterium]